MKATTMHPPIITPALLREDAQKILFEANTELVLKSIMYMDANPDLDATKYVRKRLESGICAAQKIVEMRLYISLVMPKDHPDYKRLSGRFSENYEQGKNHINYIKYVKTKNDQLLKN